MVRLVMVCDCSTEFDSDGSDESAITQRDDAVEHASANPAHTITVCLRA